MVKVIAIYFWGWKIYIKVPLEFLIVHQPVEIIIYLITCFTKIESVKLLLYFNHKH